MSERNLMGIVLLLTVLLGHLWNQTIEVLISNCRAIRLFRVSVAILTNKLTLLKMKMRNMLEKILWSQI